MPTTLVIAKPTQTLLAASEFIPQRKSSIRNSQALQILNATRNQNLQRNMQASVDTQREIRKTEVKTQNTTPT
ncbi:MAG: hypothetical protein WC304_04685 [Candidatus Gracilibacteria bacterium]|jgi:hypothetical protein